MPKKEAALDFGMLVAMGSGKATESGENKGIVSGLVSSNGNEEIIG